jgi:diguanylate cyclase (GGDEF)-like protein
MRAFTSEQPSPASAVAEGWKAFTPQPAEEGGLSNFEGGEVMEIRAALREAQAVIRVQEERIKTLEETALTDELTGLANRRGFFAAFKRELALARRDADYEGLMVMIDLDGFKSVNDTWGHSSGDAYLRAVADFLRENVRGTDTVARLGGDEFALLLTRIDETAGIKCLARLEKTFGKRTALPEGLPLRASFGFAVYTGSSKLDAVMNAADLRLYACKVHNKKLTAVR